LNCMRFKYVAFSSASNITNGSPMPPSSPFKPQGTCPAQQQRLSTQTRAGQK
jgi:hypothetical protein